MTPAEKFPSTFLYRIQSGVRATQLVQTFGHYLNKELFLYELYMASLFI